MAPSKHEEGKSRSEDKPANLSYVIMRLEDIDRTLYQASTVNRTVAQAARFNVAGDVDDLAETLHKIATAWRNQRPV